MLDWGLLGKPGVFSWVTSYGLLLSPIKLVPGKVVRQEFNNLLLLIPLVKLLERLALGFESNPVNQKKTLTVRFTNECFIC